jgi:hypothetical protein
MDSYDSAAYMMYIEIDQYQEDMDEEENAKELERKV